MQRVCYQDARDVALVLHGGVDVAGRRELLAHPVLDLGASETLVGKHTWLTEDGPVVIEVEGDTVLVTESLDQAAGERLEQEVFQPTAANR